MNRSRLTLAMAVLLTVFATAAPTSHGLDLGGMDTKVKPGDDFFAYANGAWLKATQIPPDRASYGVFTMLDEVANKRTADLVRTAASAKRGTEARKIGDYYTAFMNEALIEKRGLAPIEPQLESIAAIRDKRALASHLGSELRADVDPLNNTNFHTSRLFGLWVSPGFADPDHNVAYLLQGGLSLPDRDNYLETDAASVELQKKFRAHIAAVLTLAHIADAETKADAIYGLEHRIAEVHATRTESADVNKANNPWPQGEFSTRAPGLDWDRYFRAAGLSTPTITVWPSGRCGRRGAPRRQ
jgi:putative endopeptidase